METTVKSKKFRSNTILVVLISLVALLLLSFTLVYSPALFAKDGDERYFRFTIPNNADGTVVSYSPGWFGTYATCPQNVVVLLYNDKERYGIAYTVDKFIPSGSLLLTKDISTVVIDSVKIEEGVFKEQKLADRWLPEVEVKEVDCIVKEGLWVLANKAEYSEESLVVTTSKKAVYCPVCGEFIMWYYDGVLDSSTVLVCPKGHRLITVRYDTLEKEASLQEK